MDVYVDILLWLIIIILVVLLAAALVLYFLVNHWQKKTLTELKEVRGRLRTYEKEIARLRLQAEPFSPNDPEPYGSLASQLYAHLNQAEDKFRQLYNAYSKNQQKARQLDWRQIDDWKEYGTVLRLPSEWLALRKESQILGLEEEIESHALESADVVLNRLSNQGWESAVHARKVLEDAQNASRILAGLQSAGIRDSELDTAFKNTEEWQKSLTSQIPVYFMSGNEADIVEKADRTTISAVYRLSQQAKPQVETALKDAQAWEHRHQALEETLDELAKEFRTIAEKISALETSPVYPLNWDHTRSQLAAARESIESLGDTQHGRTLKQVDQDLAIATRNLKLLGDLSDHCQKVSDAHHDLAALMENPEVKHGADWGRKAKKIIEQVEAYDPENWPRNLSPHLLQSELNTMLDLHAGLKVKEPSTTLAESELSNSLEDVRRLSEQHREVRPRFTAVQERLGEIQETERNTRDLVSRNRALMNQAISVVGSNHHLSEAAGKEAESLRAELEKLSDEIEARSQGTVEKKAQKANALMRKIEQAANRWLDKLEDEMDARKSELAEKVGVLDNIAIIDEPAMIEAEKLLGDRESGQEQDHKRGSLLSSWSFSNGKSEKRRRQKEPLSLNDAINELKQKNEEWHRCIAAMRAIEDIEGPVLEQFERASKHAQKAQEVLLEANALIPEERSWPPTTVYIANERRQFEALEKQWGSLKQEHLKAIQLVSKLSELSDSYQNLENRAAQLAEKANQEQSRVEDLEIRLGESLRLWQYQLQSYSANLYARDEIQMLLQEAENEAEAIRLRYLRGDTPYQQALQALRSLCQQVESAHASLDQEQVIDINGVVQRRSY
jgi:hypothetical protein